MLLLDSDKLQIRRLESGLIFEQRHRGKRDRTNQTTQLETEVIKPSLGRCHPVPMRPRRIVSDMLLMPALQLGNPIAASIQMVINDLSRCAFGWGVQFVANSILRSFFALCRIAYRRTDCATLCHL